MSWPLVAKEDEEASQEGVLDEDVTTPEEYHVRDAKGELAWAQPLAGWTDEKRASEWCDKQVKFDPDLWIVEIEDREGRTFVDEPVV